jgi:hypothetical protein
MIRGLQYFRAYFAGYEGYYAVISGAACDLVFSEAGLPFRATRDIDMVLCVEIVDEAFGERLTAFLDAGGYQARERSTGGREFYRFHRPEDDRFPEMIELFARDTGTYQLAPAQAAAPMPAEAEALSLSAILLNPDYYAALQANRKVVDGVSILDERLLIPFKARAFVDLSERRANGETVRSSDIRKHGNDVFRLLQLLPGDALIDVGPAIQKDLRRFAALVEADDSLDPQQFGVDTTRDEGLAQLRAAYGLEGTEAP